jgi:hypothetical protein
MLLTDYQWSGNVRGMHITGAGSSIDHGRYTRAKFGWVKLVVEDARYVSDVAQFLAEGITPIVRLYRRSPGAAPVTNEQLSVCQAYINAGAKWFELFNEPNQNVEWPAGTWVDWRNTDSMIRPLMDNWLLWAEYIVSQRAYPGFIALSESDFDPAAAVRWMEAFLNFLAQTYYDRFSHVLNNGLFVATHPYLLNHFYQEVPGNPLAYRQPQEQQAWGGGWHFEYPYDPISQNSEPGITIYSGPPWKPHGDPVGLLAMGQMFNERAASLFGANAVPVVGTEGGIWPFPHLGQPPIQPDPRYPPITFESHAEATVAVFEWMVNVAPAWFFGLCLWKEDEYYDLIRARAIDLLENSTPLVKAVPGTAVANVIDLTSQRGPGPVHGEPDFHIVFLASDIEPHWFFDTGQHYWNMFRPIVTRVTDFMDFFPYNKSLAATIIAKADSAEMMKSLIREHYPNVRIDLILAENDLSNVGNVLNERVWTKRRFG